MDSENKCCPNCGKPMAEGYVYGGVKHYIHWFPKGVTPTAWQSFALGPPLRRPGSLEKGMLLHPVVDGIVKLPALNCPNCKIAILDYNEENIVE